jgi:hypothetical protein
MAAHKSLRENRSVKENRFRAAKACRRCNLKRIKCDAVQGTPCTRCRESGNVDCILRQSRRGTYVRKRKDSMAVEQSPGDDRRGSSPADQRDESQMHGEPGTLEATEAREARQLSMPPFIVSPALNEARPEYCETPNETEHDGRTQIQNGPANNQLRPQVLHDLSSPSTSSTTRISGLSPQESTSATSVSSSYREMPWSAMFDHFLNMRQDRTQREFVDKASITYLGESFPLAIILDDFREGGVPRLHHPGPPYPGYTPHNDLPDQCHPSHVPPQELDFLKAKGVFDYPKKPHLDEYFEVFLERVFPIYPIFNRNELVQQYQNNALPPILIHSICFLAATYCPMAILHRAGYTSRREARFSYYKKAKALFDAQYEVNKLVILQTVILMSFWGGGPNNYWNFYAWLSTGVTIAETLGLHRSMATTNMKSMDKSLLKRLWWVLVIRDAACSSLVGRPFRIDIDQCDTEMLTLEDFLHDAPTPDFLTDPRQQAFAHYQIHMSKLSLILRQIVQARFYPRKPLMEITQLHGNLVAWRSQLPPQLNWSESPEEVDIFTTTLAIYYHHNMILTYLGHTPDYNSIADLATIYDGDVAHVSAEYIASMSCLIVTKSNVLLMPHELFHGIFLAEAKFYTEMRSPHRLIAQLGRAALNNCQMVLHESWDAWDPSPWVMQLFDNLIRRVRDDEQQQQSSHANGASAPYDRLPWNPIALTSFEMDSFGGGPSYESWQSHPMLSTLFDISQDIFNYGLPPSGQSSVG